jgi:transcriptional regulator with XRE-family HTH domain/quercetin dioxygenase-like cupin family protein
MATKPASPRRPAKARLAVRDDVGRRIREHRIESNLSLRELARRLGISPSAISQIETGKSRPSVSTLYSIVTELGMSLDELFSADGRKPAARPAPAEPVAPARLTPVREQDGPVERHVQRAGTRAAIDLETGVRWERLTPRPDAEADFLYVTYDVGGASAECNRFIRHSGREYGLLLSGHLQLTVGFDEYELGPGDSICFDSTVPHRLRNVCDEPARGVWFVVGRQSDEQRRFPLEDGEPAA